MQASSARTIGLLWVLLAAVLIIPACLFALTAWQSREEALRQATITSERAALALQGHAQNVFGAFELAIERIEDRIVDPGWRDLENSPELHFLMKEIAASRPQIGSIWLIDADGKARGSSLRHPADPVDVSDRDYMKAFRQGHRTIFVGEPVARGVTGSLAFTVARPRFDEDGGFAGAILIVASPAYFEDFYRESLPALRHSAGLVRSDGIFLVRQSHFAATSGTERAGANFLRAVTEGGTHTWIGRSSVDGLQRIATIRKLERFPVYVVFGIDMKAVLAGWRDQMRDYAIFAIPAMIGLVSLSGLALARTRRAHLAVMQLADEMHRRQNSEAMLAKAQRMEALGQLTGGIAHDFNNLLTVILGSLDLLTRAKDEARRSRLVSTALQAVEQGRVLTSQLLTFSRRQALFPEPVDVNRLVRSMDEMLARTLRGDIRCEFNLQEDLAAIEVDPSQLQIALINLAANSRDAMPRGGTFRVRTFSAHDDDRDVIALEVSDTGEGMPPDVIARAGEPFFTTKEIGKGTGLGLAQVHGFAEQSGGTLHIRSIPGEGTTVTLLLPQIAAGRSVVHAGDPAGTPPDPVSPARVLLVEDNEQVAEIVRMLLAEQGHVVLQASDAVSAMAILSREADRLDVVFADLVMPGEQDGLDLAHAIRRQWPQLPVILATGFNEAAARATESEFPLLAKPFEAQAIHRAVREALLASRSRPRRLPGNTMVV
jgi:two-component system, NtrC family, sensor kinase